jgi:hypothetical protein
MAEQGFSADGLVLLGYVTTEARPAARRRD